MSAPAGATLEAPRFLPVYFETLDEHLDFLRSAGFRLVDCFWKRLDLVLIGGYKSPGTST